MTGLKTATTRDLVVELLTRDVSTIRAELMSYPAPCMLIKAADYEADIMRATGEGVASAMNDAKDKIADAYQRGKSDGMLNTGEPRFTSSIEIGTPSKGGAIKVYVDPANPTEARQRIDAMIDERAHAAERVNGGASQ